jgi:hypothetical protein
MQPSMPHSTPQPYQFRIREELDNDLAVWFSPLVIDHEPNGVTTLTGFIRDQAELHGMLIKIRDLNLTLLSVINQ